MSGHSIPRVSCQSHGCLVRGVRVPFVGVYDDGSKTAINSICVLPTYGLAVHRVQGAPVEFGTAKERPGYLSSCSAADYQLCLMSPR